MGLKRDFLAPQTTDIRGEKTGKLKVRNLKVSLLVEAFFVVFLYFILFFKKPKRPNDISVLLYPILSITNDAVGVTC